MINPTTEVIQRDGDDGRLQKLPHSKIEQRVNSPKVAKKDSNSGLRKVKSPKSGKRLLPDAPNFLKGGKEGISKSSDDLLTSIDDKNASNTAIMNKYKYNSLPRKKEKAQRTLSSTSTFYINADTNLTPEKKSDSSNSQSTSPLPGKKKISSQSNVSSVSNNDNNNITHTEKQTHVALYKFYARHKDELAFCEGDPIQVLKYFDDLWYEGLNLSTGKQGVFPCRYVADILASDIVMSIDEEHEHRQFHMRFLGSVEVNSHKGDEILCFAIAKVVNQRSMLSTSNPPSCVIQISPRGIRICDLDDNIQQNQEIDRKPKKGKQIEKINTEETSVSHFFSLKNVTYCGNHPKDRRYFGFITKHPDEHRFACHIFMSKYSTDNVSRIIGDCFQKFYSSYMEHRAPIEDIYIEE